MKHAILLQNATGLTRYLRTLVPARRRKVTALLDAFAGFLATNTSALATDWARIHPCDFSRAACAVASSSSPRTVNAIRRCVTAVLREEHENGLLDLDRQRALLGIRWPNDLPLRSAPPCLCDARALFAVCQDDPSPRGARDAALIALLWSTPLSAKELQYLESARASRIMQSAEPLHAQALSRWLDVRGAHAGPCLLSISRGNRVVARAITRQSLSNAVRHRGNQAGLPWLTPAAVRISARQYVER